MKSARVGSVGREGVRDLTKGEREWCDERGERWDVVVRVGRGTN